MTVHPIAFIARYILKDMGVAAHRKSIIFFIAFGACLAAPQAKRRRQYV